MKYLVYCDDTLIYDPEIPELSLIDPQLDLCLNDAGQFTFTVPPNHPYKDLLKPMISTITVYRNTTEDMIFTGRIIEPVDGFNKTTQYTCEGALAYLNDSIQPQAEFHDIRPMGYLEVLLEEHNKQVPENRQIKRGAVTVVDPNDSLYRYTNFNSTLEEIKEDIIDDLGGYCRIRKESDGLYLDILKEYGVRNSQTIDLGENLIDFTGTGGYTDLCSVIIPLGAKIETISEDEKENNENDALDKYTTIEEVNDGFNYLVRKDLYDKYGGIWRVVHWDNVHTPAMLKTRAEQWLQEGQFETFIIDASALDKSYVDIDIESFNLGDEIRVTSKPHNLDRWMTLSNMTISLDHPSNNVITLGGTGKPITLSGVTTDIQVQTGELDDKIVIPNKLIEQAINQATQLINSMTHGYVIVEPNEILIMDTDDPETAQNVWRWNMGGLGFSHNGYEGPFETAITMDGTIVGKFLAANSVAAEQLDVNYRTQVENNIQLSEENANIYTDSKLKNYYTKSQVEVQLQTTSDSILLSAQENAEVYTDRKLGDYYTKAEINVKTDSILSQVTNKLSGYSTTVEMNSAINQKANEITSSVSRTYATKNEMGQLQTSIESVEAKITEKGIFATINAGLKGSEQITNTKFSVTRDGITVQGGGLTIKNNSGTSVLYADTSGNLTLRGDIMHYGSGSLQAIGIENHEVRVYAWNQSGNYIGSLGAIAKNGTNAPMISLWSDYGDDIQIGSRRTGFAGPTGSTFQVDSIIEMGTYGGRLGIHYIRDTIDGNLYAGTASLRFDHGLITGISPASGSAGTTDELPLGDGSVHVVNGCITGWNFNRVKVGTIPFGGGSINVANGMITSWHLPNPSGSIRVSRPEGGGWTLSIGNGVISRIDSF